MKIFIDWAKIESPADFYTTFLPQIEAPDWHGRNLDALHDSMVNGSINGIEPPFCVINTNVDQMGEDLQSFFQSVLGILEEARKEGRNIRVFEE